PCLPRPPTSSPFPSTTLFRSPQVQAGVELAADAALRPLLLGAGGLVGVAEAHDVEAHVIADGAGDAAAQAHAAHEPHARALETKAPPRGAGLPGRIGPEPGGLDDEGLGDRVADRKSVV